MSMLIYEEKHKMSANKQKYENCIILNKPFVGEYIGSDGHDAHELINFYKADNGLHFLYNNPYGQNVNIKEFDGIPNVKYMLFCTEGKGKPNKNFYIEYVAEIENSLHLQTISKVNIKNPKKVKEYMQKGIEEINNVLSTNYKKYNCTTIDDITYDGTQILSLFSDELGVIPVTFVCKKMYKLKERILINGNEKDFDYNFQRNFGYVSETNNSPKAYKILIDIIASLNLKNAMDINKFKPIDIKKNRDDLSALEKNTFLDLISMHKEEESYTKLIGNLICCDKRLINKFVLSIVDEPSNNKISKYRNKLIKKCNFDNFNHNGHYLDTEYKIDDGRIDLYTENDTCRLIIENKIESGINYSTNSIGEYKSQIENYYSYFSKSSDKVMNIFVILAPEYKHEEIINELNQIGTIKDYWQIIGYKFITNFIKDSENIIKKTKYGKYYNDIYLLCKRQSFSRSELAQIKLTRNKTTKNTNAKKLTKASHI